MPTIRQRTLALSMTAFLAAAGGLTLLVFAMPSTAHSCVSTTAPVSCGDCADGQGHTHEFLHGGLDWCSSGQGTTVTSTSHTHTSTTVTKLPIDPEELLAFLESESHARAPGSLSWALGLFGYAGAN